MEDEIQLRQVAVIKDFVYACKFKGERMVCVIVYKVVRIYRDTGYKRDKGALNRPEISAYTCADNSGSDNMGYGFDGS